MTPARAMSTPRTAATSRSHLGTVAMTLTALSAAAFGVMIVGSLLDWNGFSSDETDVSTFADVTWTVFALGGLAALLCGIAAWIRGSRRERLADVRAGQLAVGWFVLALAVSVIWSALA